MGDLLSRDEAARIAEDAADRAVRKAVPDAIREALVRVGLDPDHPQEMQADAQWTRQQRTRCQAAGARAWVTTVAIVVAATAALLIDGMVSRVRAILGGG